MVRAWHIDESKLDENKLELSENERELVNLEDLKEHTGVLYWKLNADTYNEDGTLDEIRKCRGYTYADEIEVSSKTLPNFDVMIKKFASEHLHTDEEIRFILAGKGYFDVRDANSDDWIRIEVVGGDLIILPAGIYHRLVLDKDRYIKAKRNINYSFSLERQYGPHMKEVIR
ncbi:1,2-dihydroxy-3-keto-5-methylthiopentene dioxygenase isoform X2 [Folsomia candida]|uniref:1,2-dihydroxy-3-keto-5-methylthiopentene dioxygenase isoform X2 n=1 Tax=Folsomia candida TaxID=158441 RepID=UPI000B8FB731|nr:1,2-dihydroxy-3-keto-5-methylthiopentene dioxygenase isoform X2 [Folsomia candida]